MSARVGRAHERRDLQLPVAPRSRRIARAAESHHGAERQHAPRLIAALQEQRGCHSIVLEKKLGNTRIVDGAADVPAWHRPAR
jgi:hypothetical protein